MLMQAAAGWTITQVKSFCSAFSWWPIQLTFEIQEELNRNGAEVLQLQ